MLILIKLKILLFTSIIDLVLKKILKLLSKDIKLLINFVTGLFISIVKKRASQNKSLI